MKKILIVLLLSVCKLHAQDIEAQLKEAIKSEGFFDFYWLESKGKVFLEVKNIDQEFIYYPSLSQGIGSNDLGLDRGRLGQEHLVKWQKMGNKLLLVEPNTRYRAISDDAKERKAIKESFARSVLFGFDILKTTDGKFIIDLTPFLLRDAVEAIQSISTLKQGSYSFDASRSAVDKTYCKSFPNNTEFEALISLSGSNPGNYVSSVVPTAEHITMQQHHSFVKLPEPGFKMRKFDPRIGYGGISFFDYATPINSPIEKHYISRHRLEKLHPERAMSEAVKPIIYYLDPGTPEPIRSALFEGATWWNQAFEAAGFINAFQVKMLPDHADPMDVRYNLIQWVHRSTRGWSYGMSINDPRTGEILKGKVTLGSLRVRQDYLIALGLIGDYSEGKSDSLLMKMSLNRLKQLSAHEIGHTLGLPHNYYSSTTDRSSVMDYPHPHIEEKNGQINLADAYADGIGSYDKISIKWGYQEVPKGESEAQMLENIVQEALAQKHIFLTDQDARPDASVHPNTHLWDNGPKPSVELNRMIGIRKKVLENLDLKKIPKGSPVATMEDVLVPMYMMHRYQVQGAAKSIAGANYTNTLNGDGQLIYVPVSKEAQSDALNAILSTLDAKFLALPKQIRALLPPRPFRYESNPREVFKRRTGLSFDLLSPAEASIQLSLSLLLNPTRLSRLAQQSIHDASLQGLDSYFKSINGRIFQNRNLVQDSYEAQINRLLADMYVAQLRTVLNHTQSTVDVKVHTMAELTRIKAMASSAMGTFGTYLKSQIDAKGDEYVPNAVLMAPDGQPIDEDMHWLD